MISELLQPPAWASSAMAAAKDTKCATKVA